MGYHFKEKNINRKYCERNVAREYPYSIPTYDYLWLKWPLEEVKNDLGINDEFLLNERKKYVGINIFSEFINTLKKNKFIKSISKNLKKIFKIKNNILEN